MSTRKPSIEVSSSDGYCLARTTTPLVAGTRGAVARVTLGEDHDGMDEVWVCWYAGDKQVDQLLDPDNPILELPDELLEVPGEVLMVGTFAKGVRDGRRMTIPSIRASVDIIRNGTADHPHQ